MRSRQKNNNELIIKILHPAFKKKIKAIRSFKMIKIQDNSG